tara:strand:- start:430 stop:909 length:480 start_codon:yes stop_codon:yes gene_type:complete
MNHFQKYAAAKYLPFLNTPTPATPESSKPVIPGPITDLSMSKEDRLVENMYRTLGTRNPYGVDNSLFDRELNLPKIKDDYTHIPIKSTKPKKHTGFGSTFKNKLEELKHKYPKLYKFVDERAITGQANLGALGRPEYELGEVETPFGQDVLGGKLTWRF